MDINLDINTSELKIADKCILKPLMTIEEINDSNLKELLDENSEIQLENQTTYPLFITHIIDGQEVKIKLDITDKKLVGIYVTVDTKGILECNNTENNRKNGHNDVQIPQIEGIDDVEYKKVQDLYNMFGEFPNEDNLTESIKDIQSEVKSINEQINHLNEEKSELESTEEAINIIEDIYARYEKSGFDKNILKENLDTISKYEKVKEVLKTTDIKNNIELKKRIEEYTNNIENLEQTKNNLNAESNLISDSYSAYQKYIDIGTKRLNELKKELLCSLKAKDELRYVLAHNDDKRVQNFCQDKIKEINTSLDKLDNEIDSIGITFKCDLDDKIDYMKQKVEDEKRYLKENGLLNNNHIEYEIKEITKNAIEEIKMSVSNMLNAINELYNMENKIAEVQKEIELKESIIEVQKERKILEDVKEKLETVDKYKPIVVTMDEYEDNISFRESYENKYGEKIKEYNKAIKYLDSINIGAWDKYKEVRSKYDEKEKELLGDRRLSDVTNLDNLKEFEKIVKYKNKQNQIIKKYGNKINEIVNENFDIIDNYETSRSDKDILEADEDNTTKSENYMKISKVTNKKYKVKAKNSIEDNMDDKEKIESEDNANSLENLDNENDNSNIEKQEQTENNLNIENNEIYESSNEYHKDKNISVNDLEQLKKILICNLKAKDELMHVFVNSYNGEIQEFCGQKIKEINIDGLDTEINKSGINDKTEIDDKIDYMKQKLTEEKRYLKENYSLNDYNNENQINDIVKNTLKEIEPIILEEFEVINELYNIENKILEVRKEVEQKEELMALQKQEEILKLAKEKLKIIDTYKPIVSMMNNTTNNTFFRGLYSNAFIPQVEEYNEVKKELEKIKITNWDEFEKLKSTHESKKQNLLGNKNQLKVKKLNINKELDEISKYENKQNEVIEKYKNQLNEFVDKKQDSIDNEDNIEKLDLTSNYLDIKKNGISDSFSDNGRDRDVDTNNLEKLKKELLCNLKAKYELRRVYMYSNDNRTLEFCEEKIKEADTNIEQINKNINAIGILQKSEIDDKINYMEEKLADEKGYLQVNDNSNTENEIEEIAKSAMEETELDSSSILKAVYELNSIEDKIGKIQKEIGLKQDIIDLRKEKENLENAEKMLRKKDKYKPIIERMNNQGNDKFFEGLYKNAFFQQNKEYDEAVNQLISININNWEEYKIAKNAYDKKEKKLLMDKVSSNITSLNINKDFEKINEYKKKKNEIIRKYDNPVNQLKKEILCNIKAKDELQLIIVRNNDKKTQEFCKEKNKEIERRMLYLENKLNAIGITDRNKIDDKIGYLKQKLTDEKRYWQENHELNDNNIENEIIEITKNAMEGINSNMLNTLKSINELYNTQNKITEVQKEVGTKEEIIELQKDEKTVETAKEKLKKVAEWFVIK